MPPPLVVTGVPQLDRALRGLTPALAKKVIRGAIRRSLKPVRSAVVAAVPKGETGKLRKAVKIRSAGGKRGVVGLAVSVGAKDFAGEAFYGLMVEYGTKRQRAQRNMKRAFDATKDRAERQVGKEVKAGVSALAKG